MDSKEPTLDWDFAYKRKGAENKNLDNLVAPIKRCNYITSKLHAQNNPDIMFGGFEGTTFIPGNMYFSEILTCQEALRLKQEGNNADLKEGEGEVGTMSDEEAVVSPNENQSDEPQAQESVEDKQRGNTRVFEDLNKSVVCRNCGEIGHKERKCPNEIRKEHCKLCGHTEHRNANDVCSFILCYKCNQSGHVLNNCNPQNIIVCNKCRFNGHTDKDCIGAPFNKINGLYGVLCINCGK